MTKPERKLTPAEKAAKRKRQQEFMTVFFNGKMKRVRRPPMIEGMPVEEFVRRNADPIWLLQEGRWEEIENESSGGGRENDWTLAVLDAPRRR